MGSLLAYAIPAFIIVAFALGLAFACFVQYRLTSAASPELRLVVLMLVVGIGALLSVALMSRELDDSKVTGAPTYADVVDGFAASRWISLFLIVASFIEIARGWIEERRRALPDPAQPLLFTMLAYYVGTVLIQAVASDVPDFSARSLYVPVVLAAIYYQRPVSIDPIIGAARLVILTLMLGSLACIWLRPDFVIHRPEPGIIPGIDWRLFGLTPHANALGPIALLAILIELHSPARWKTLRWLALLSAMAVLVLAQSKTTWVTMPLMLLFVWLPLRLAREPADADAAGHFRRTVLTLIGLIVVLVLTAAAAAAFDVAGYLEHRVDLVTLTGRTQIWDITLRAWRENVLFGYGAGIWGPERQMEFQMFYVGQAHNQVVQTLGEAGLVGLALLLVYLFALLLAALRNFAASRGFVLMLLMLMLVRCVTEAPMRSEGILSWSTFLHALLLVMACHYAREPRRSPVADRVAAVHAARAGARQRPDRRLDECRGGCASHACYHVPLR
jgi:exopolysaccharide production protein ExoQ